VLFLDETDLNTFMLFILLSVCAESIAASQGIVHMLLTGFGFLTFEQENSVDLVVNEHFIQIFGKQVVIVIVTSVY